MQKPRCALLVKRLTVLTIVLLASFAVGCGRKEAPEAVREGERTPEAELSSAVPQPVQTGLKYALVRIIPGGLEGLRGIAIDRRDRIYLAGASGLKVMDAEGRNLPHRCPRTEACGGAS